MRKKLLDGVLESEDVGTYFSLLYEPDDELKTGEIWQKDGRCIYQSNPIAVEKKAVYKNIIKKRTAAILYENKRENYLVQSIIIYDIEVLESKAILIFRKLNYVLEK